MIHYEIKEDFKKKFFIIFSKAKGKASRQDNSPELTQSHGAGV